jgi:hypothetical protein
MAGQGLGIVSRTAAALFLATLLSLSSAQGTSPTCPTTVKSTISGPGLMVQWADPYVTFNNLTEHACAAKCAGWALFAIHWIYTHDFVGLTKLCSCSPKCERVLPHPDPTAPVTVYGVPPLGCTFFSSMSKCSASCPGTCTQWRSAEYQTKKPSSSSCSQMPGLCSPTVKCCCKPTQTPVLNNHGVMAKCQAEKPISA